MSDYLYSQWKIPADGGPAVEQWVVDLPPLDIYQRFGTYEEAAEFWRSLAIDWRIIQS
tara:strand:+ start:204 stop:377 length:174 start_codon:yes stop_codon:yes gene_type:complete